MPNQTIDADVRTVRELTEDDLAWCDVLHYSRHSQMSPSFLDSMRKKYGFKIVVDTDDWWETPKDHPMHQHWIRSNIALQIRNHLMNADAVTVTNSALAEKVRGLNQRVHIIENGVDYGNGQFVPVKKPKSGRVRLLYASTIMNYTNTSIITKAMHKLAHLPIEIIIAGHHDSPFFDILINNLTAFGKIPHKLTGWRDCESYMSGYVGDIGILPSKPTEFNSCKSNLKVLEYAAVKIPVVVSNCAPYLDLPVNYFSGENSFVDQVTALVNDVKYRKKCGDELYRFCTENYSLSNFAKKRKEAYEF